MGRKKKNSVTSETENKQPAIAFVQTEEDIIEERENIQPKQSVERTALNHATNNDVEIDGIQFRRSRSAIDQTDRRVLDISADLLNPNLSYRWVNEDRGLVEKRREMGYEKVASLKGRQGEEITTRIRVGAKKDGSDLFAVLMATPKKWKDEREAAQELQRKSQIENITRGSSDGKENLGNDFYTKQNTKIQ